jgi:ATP-dependent Zn protease
MTSKLWRIAIHEAGHAVIGRLFDLPCGTVSIKPSDDGESLGHAIIDDPIRSWQRGDGSRRALVEASCVAIYAGAEAERVILNCEPSGDQGDCSTATSLISIMGVRGASFVGDDVWDRYEGRLRERATKLVRLHQATIERVASDLMKHESLTDEEIRKLI